MTAVETRIKRKMILFAAGATMLLATIMAAFGTPETSVTYPGELRNIVEETNVPRPALEHGPAPSQESQTREIRVERGDTVAGIIAALGIRDDALAKFLKTNAQASTIHRQLAPGKIITAKIDGSGELSSLSFPLNGNGANALLIERQAGTLTAQALTLPSENTLAYQSAVIRHSLFGAADEAGIPDNIATQIVDIFGADIDFHRDLRRGDRFSVIYETAQHQGRQVGSQRILAAEFINDGKTYQAFWHALPGATGGYYSADGRSLKKAFLRSPLEFSRVTSGFSNARYHPILQEIRAHKGIDYGAPSGTRVKATGDGVVEFAGFQGGYGNVVTIRHAGDKQTVYGHLSGFASGLKKGSRVSQGQTIGYVGSSGLATGPHLHYEFRVAGIHRNPLSITLPTAAPLSSSEIPSFQANAAALKAQLALLRTTQVAMLD